MTDIHTADCLMTRGVNTCDCGAAERLAAELAHAEKRADEMEGKAGEWIAAHIHKERMRAAESRAAAAEARVKELEKWIHSIKVNCAAALGDISARISEEP